MGWMGGFSDPNWNFPCICCVLWVVQETPLILAGFFHISAASARTSGRLALSLYISYTFRLNWHVFIMKMLLASHKAAQTPGLAQRLPLLTGRTAQSFHKECGHRESGRVEAILKSSLCPTEWNKPEREKQMLYINTYMGDSQVAKWWRIHKQCRRYRFAPSETAVWKMPWNSKWKLTPVFLPGKSHGQRSLVGYSPWVTNN